MKITTASHYRVTLSNGSTYYGRTTRKGNVIFSEHKNSAKKGRHDSKYVQEVYNKYGCKDWKFEILTEETGNNDHHNRIEFNHIKADPKSININNGKTTFDRKKYKSEWIKERRKRYTPEEREVYLNSMKEYYHEKKKERESR